MENSRKLRILYLITDLGKGGAERYLIDLCTELKRTEDIEFIIGSLFDNNQYVELTKDFNVVNLDFETFSFRKNNECNSYKHLLEAFNPHIVHTHRFLAEFLSSYYVNPKIKYVCHGHDNMVQFNEFEFATLMSKEKLMSFFEKKYLIQKKYKVAPTYFIANSTDTLTFYKRHLIKDLRNRILLLQCGIKFENFYKDLSQKNVASDKCRILNVGSFQPKKNQVFIIEIAKELRYRGFRFEINLVGEGEVFERVKELIIENELQEYVILRGLINNVSDWYKSSDVYLHTSFYEPFGLVLLEAMASGLPVVCLDGKGNRDIIENGKNGFIFEDQNPKLFADAIIEIFKNEELKNNITTYAQTYAEKFSIRYKTMELVSFYKRILKD